MEKNYTVLPEFREVCDLLAPVLANDQEYTQALIEQGYQDWRNHTSDDEIKVTNYSIPSVDSKMIDVQLIELQNGSDSPAPCLIYYHGGGFIIPLLASHYGFINEYIRGTACKVVCVNYRVAPDAFPIPFEDCWHTLLWTVTHADSLGIDKDRIALGGDSAGGLFTAAVALKARDVNGPKIIGQMLAYPVTDARMQTESMKKYTDTPVWNAPMTEIVWKLFLKDGDQGMRSYCSPMEAESFADLPSAYVEVAEFDCLHDEGINYANALKNAGVPTELNETQNTIHGYDYILGSKIVREGLDRRIAFLKRIFEK